MFVLLCLLCFAPLIALLYLASVAYKYRSLSIIPGPTAIPFWSTLPKSNKGVYEWWDHLINTYGETSKFFMGPFIRVVTIDTKIIEHLCKSNIHLKKTLIYGLLQEWIGEGLLILTGGRWKARRKLLTPTFHFSILTNFLTIMEEASELLVKHLKEQEGQLSVDLLEFTQPYSLDIIGETSMECKLKCQQNQNREYLNATNIFLDLTLSRLFHVWQTIPQLYKLFSKNANILHSSLSLMHHMSKTAIIEKYEQASKNDRGDSKESSSKKKYSLIETLFRNRVRENLTDDNIQAEIDTFLFEGFDTVSRGLAFALYNIGHHPEIQQRLYEEIVSTFGDNSASPTKTEILGMQYLDMVVKESLRLHPSVVLIERELEVADTIDGIFYPRGTVFSVLLFWLHRNPKYYPNPEKFDPERFSPENAAKIPNFAYIPFSAGPRNCIGQKFALLELKSALVRVLRDLEILPVPGHKLDLVPVPLLGSQTGISVRIKRRN